MVWPNQKPHFDAFKDMHTHFDCDITQSFVKREEANLIDQALPATQLLICGFLLQEIRNFEQTCAGVGKSREREPQNIFPSKNFFIKISCQ